MLLTAGQALTGTVTRLVCNSPYQLDRPREARAKTEPPLAGAAVIDELDRGCRLAEWIMGASPFIEAGHESHTTLSELPRRGKEFQAIVEREETNRTPMWMVQRGVKAVLEDEVKSRNGVDFWTRRLSPFQEHRLVIADVSSPLPEDTQDRLVTGPARRWRVPQMDARCRH